MAPPVSGIVIQGGITVGPGINIGSGGPVVPIDLLTIATYLSNYVTVESTSGGLRNPDFYQYSLDGNEFSIDDGGGDMFDSGNYTAPALLDDTSYINSGTISDPPALSYATIIVSVTDTDFNYISLGYGNPANNTPLTMLGTRASVGNPCGFQKAGDIGADGDGDIVYGNVYTGQVFNGFTTYAYYRQTYNNGDPSICDLYILLGHPSWGSVFGTVTSDVNTSTYDQGAIFFVDGGSTQNILAITTLLSVVDSSEIPLGTVESIVQNYTNLIGEALGI